MRFAVSFIAFLGASAVSAFVPSRPALVGSPLARPLSEASTILLATQDEDHSQRTINALQNQVASVVVASMLGVGLISGSPDVVVAAATPTTASVPLTAEKNAIVSQKSALEVATKKYADAQKILADAKSADKTVSNTVQLAEKKVKDMKKKLIKENDDLAEAKRKKKSEAAISSVSSKLAKAKQDLKASEGALKTAKSEQSSVSKVLSSAKSASKTAEKSVKSTKKALNSAKSKLTKAEKELAKKAKADKKKAKELAQKIAKQKKEQAKREAKTKAIAKKKEDDKKQKLKQEEEQIKGETKKIKEAEKKLKELEAEKKKLAKTL